MAARSKPLQVLLKRLTVIQETWRTDMEHNPTNTAAHPVETGPSNWRDYPAGLALYALCELAEDVAQRNLEPADLDELLAAASDFQDEVIDYEYGGGWDEPGRGLDFIPIACKNIVKEPRQGKLDLPSDANKFLHEFKGLLARVLSFNEFLPQRAEYDPTTRPSEAHTSPLARFHPHRVASATPELTALTEARCEITSTDSAAPLALAISQNDVASLLGATGRDGISTLSIQPISLSQNAADAVTVDIDAHFEGVPYAMCLDGQRSLAWLGDQDRVKAYRWTLPENADSKGSVQPLHTFASKGYGGAMFLRNAGGRIFRSGTCGMAIWDLASLAAASGTTASNVGRGKGKKKAKQDGGSPPTTTVEAKALSEIVTMDDHPDGSGNILAIHRSEETRRCTRVSAVDLETHKIAARFLGHSADVNCIATSKELRDPTGFVTAASDGGVRFYDTRLPTPQFAIDHGEEKIYTAVYEHIGGHPFIIFGAHKSQQIQVWDVRGRAALYQLSTGNNAVRDLAWDAPSQSLFAATEFSNGLRGYRWAGSEEEQFLWPKMAWHGENEFGVPFDAGNHRIIRYKFKSDANPNVVPASGRTA
ncbi:WD40 repeat-containing protein [Mycena kentingensis (nom. inval.)]|nr:WD40 repeat-containing protein [Mycena kentingensis (nom. inval.)]